DTRHAVAALCPGQGSQYVGMGRTLALSFPSVRERLAAVDGLFLADGGARLAGATPLPRAGGEPRLSEAVYPPAAFADAGRADQEARLRATAFAQPAIAPLSAAMFGLLRDAGFEPDFAAGHSFGELTALWAAGAMEEDVLFQLGR